MRSDTGAMMPLNALVTVERIVGPDTLERFNSFPAAQDPRQPAPGYSSGQAIAAIEAGRGRDAAGSDFSIDWTGSAYQELATGGTGDRGLRASASSWCS